ncbi:MAG TPA: hypothetical protein VJJ52_01340 [Candidatus Nanoarchaeia archaeon]|nr:hypothetical protein [Candidatus Nanoarchaeia archaeon]
MDYQNIHPAHAARVYMEKYPKFLLLFITFLLAYFLFYGRNNLALHAFVISTGYLGIFIAGLMFSYGFTTAPAISLFLILAEHQNIYAATIIGGFGALLSDLIIFRFIRASFADEIEKLSKEKLIVELDHHTPSKLKKYFLPVMAGFIIASPLPDEIGVTLLASIRSISTSLFTLISYASNTFGIFVILTVGKMIS